MYFTIPSTDRSSDQLDFRVLYQPRALVILFVLLKLAKSLTGPCYNAPFFILLAFHYFVAAIESKLHLKTGSHNDSKIYIAMNRIEKVHDSYTSSL